jgi:hypothetical protein
VEVTPPAVCLHGFANPHNEHGPVGIRPETRDASGSCPMEGVGAVWGGAVEEELEPLDGGVVDMAQKAEADWQ